MAWTAHAMAAVLAELPQYHALHPAGLSEERVAAIFADPFVDGIRPRPLSPTSGVVP